MSLIVFLIILAVGGLIVGALARLAVPGPDPMGIGGTILLGIGGSFIGGIIARVTIGTYGGFVFALVGAIILLILYRKFVQHRPLTGPGSRLPPR